MADDTAGATTGAGHVGGVRAGTLANGMEFATWGDGPRTLLFMPGGPGSSVPSGWTGRMSRRWFDPFVHAGYAVWFVTRRRGMPRGHTIADMADDYARAVVDDLGGRVDLLVGESFGGMVAQHLASRHRELCSHVAVVVAAGEVSEWGKEVDSRLAAAITRGDVAGVGSTFAEYALPGRRSRWARRLVGPWLGRALMSGKHFPREDLLVETEAEMAFEAWGALRDIDAPVALLCGDHDLFFPEELVERTVALIPHCSRVRYEGLGHIRVASSKRVPHDVLAFVESQR